MGALNPVRTTPDLRDLLPPDDLDTQASIVVDHAGYCADRLFDFIRTYRKAPEELIGENRLPRTQRAMAKILDALVEADMAEEIR
jgi:hypothetical protein